MNVERDLLEFHAAVGATIGVTPGLRDTTLRARLIAEEAAETVIALVGSESAERILWRAEDDASRKVTSGSVPNLVEAIDGCIDTIYVAVGTLVALGVPMEPVWNLVHAANMAKVNGPVDEHGKRLKPPGWVSPNAQIRELIAGGFDANGSPVA